MKVDDALRHIHSLFLDSAPVVYYVEKQPHYIDRADAIFDHIRDGRIIATASAVTLAECLVLPIRQSQNLLIQEFTDALSKTFGIEFQEIDESVAKTAADIRARYRLALPDAFQIAAALAAQCDAFLTNDIALKKVTEIPILLLDDLTV